MTDLPFPDLPETHPANKIDPKMLRFNDSAFAPKLRFQDRLAVAALQLAGMNSIQVALAYGVNRRTATRMLDPNKYKDVTEERMRLGDDAFIAKYVTEEAVAKVDAFAGRPELEETHRETTPKGVRAKVPNKRASTHQGINVHKPANAPHSHRIEVKYHKPHEDAPEGWWTLLLDESGMEDTWFGDVDEFSHLTSASALKYAKAYLDQTYGG